MRRVLLCLLLVLPASATPLDHLLRTPPWEVREGDAAEALSPVLDAVRAADRSALDGWIEHPAGENPLGDRLLDDAAAALALGGFAHPDDPLDERSDPDLEPLRTLGRLLAADAIRLGRDPGEGWHAAAQRLRAAVRLGHHLGAAPGLTRVIVGVAVHQRVVQALEPLAGHPGIPNLHGTLADLANQRIDVLPAAWAQLARPALNDPLVQEARDAVEGPERLDEAAWEELLHRLALGLAVETEPEEGQPLPPLPPAAAAALAAATPLYADAGFHAISLRGEDPNGVPDARLLIEGVLVTWDRLRGEAWADTLLPYHKLRRRLLSGKAAESAGTAPARPLAEKLLLPFVSTPLPALAAAADLDRRLKALQGAEALRLHAARAGRFPAALVEAEPPVPDDPFTGKPPRYEVEADGSAASLIQGGPAG